jgi:hypothetical protein
MELEAIAGGVVSSFFLTVWVYIGVSFGVKLINCAFS